MCNRRCMCEIIGPGSLSVEDREKYYFPEGRPLFEPGIEEKIKASLNKVKIIEVKNVK